MTSLSALTRTAPQGRHISTTAAAVDARVIAAIPMVHRTAREFARKVPRFVDREELVAAGLLGLTQASKAYDPSKGVPFEVYARTRVSGAILDDLRSRDWMTRQQRTKAKVVIDAMRSMQSDHDGGRRPRARDIAMRTNLNEGDVNSVLCDLDRAHRLAQPGEVSDPAIAEMVRSLDADPLDEVLDSEASQTVRHAVQLLPPRLRFVITGVFFEARQMQAVAADLGVTPSRVSQLVAEGLDRLRRVLSQTDDERPLSQVRAS